MAATFLFMKIFALSLLAILPLLVFLSVIILGLGFWAGRLEGWKPFDRIYWSFITATTVGYGDKRPTHFLSKLFSIIIALSGIILTGIIVSCAVFSAGQALKHRMSEPDMQQIQQQMKQIQSDFDASLVEGAQDEY